MPRRTQPKNERFNQTMTTVAQEGGNLKSFTLSVGNPDELTAAVHAAFPWREQRKVQMLKGNNLVTLRAIGDFAFTPADVAAVSALAAELDKAVEETPVVTVPWHGGRVDLPTKRDRSRRRSNGSKAGANSLRFGRFSNWTAGGMR